MTRLKVTERHAGERLDVFLATTAGLSRARAGGLIDGGSVEVNGLAGRKSYRVAAGDEVVVSIVERQAPRPPDGVVVVYEDEDLLVVSKPSGVVVHAAPGVKDGTLVDALGAQGKQLAPRAGAGRAGIVHRLDRDVSGLLLVAKTDLAHRRLVAAMKAREIERTYAALVVGDPSADRGKIDAPVGRNPRHRTRMAVVSSGRAAVTWFSVQRRFGSCALLDVRLETGRTHQIRAHMASIGHPIVGDPAYGGDPSLARSLGLERPFLHARRLELVHPISGRPLSFDDELPSELALVLEGLAS